MIAVTHFLTGLGPLAVLAICALLACVLAGIVASVSYAISCAQSVFYQVSTPDIEIGRPPSSPVAPLPAPVRANADRRASTRAGSGGVLHFAEFKARSTR